MVVGVIATYCAIANSEYPIERAWETDMGC